MFVVITCRDPRSELRGEGRVLHKHGLGSGKGYKNKDNDNDSAEKSGLTSLSEWFI